LYSGVALGAGVSSANLWTVPTESGEINRSLASVAICAKCGKPFWPPYTIRGLGGKLEPTNCCPDCNAKKSDK